MTAATCTGPDCTRPVQVKIHQLCKPHAKQLAIRGDRSKLKPLEAPRGPYALDTPCTECGRPYYARGLCKMHYYAGRPGAPAKPCSLDWCDRPSHRRGLCNGHYQQQRRGEEFRPLVVRKRVNRDKPCSFEGCGRPASSKGLCSGHYWQSRHHDELTPIGSLRTPRQPRERKPKTETSKMPPGWNRKTLKQKRQPGEIARYERGAANGIVIDFIVPTLPPEIADMAREKLLRRGAGDLLEMLGLAEAS